MTDDLATVEVHVQGDVVVVRLAGEVDIANAPAVQSEIHAALDNETVGLILDLTDLHYLDSSGIRLVITLHKQLAARRQQLQVVRLEGGVAARLFALVGLEAAIPCSTDVAQAIAAMRTRRDEATS